MKTEIEVENPYKSTQAIAIYASLNSSTTTYKFQIQMDKHTGKWKTKKAGQRNTCLKIVAPSNSCTSGMREPWGKGVPPKESVPKHIQACVRQAAVCKCDLSSSKPLNITTIENTWCYGSKKT